MPKFKVKWHGVKNVNGEVIIQATDVDEAMELVQDDPEAGEPEIQCFGLDDIEIDECEEME
jgi:hypothetical protein